MFNRINKRVFALVGMICVFAAANLNAQTTYFGISAELGQPYFKDRVIELTPSAGKDLNSNVVNLGDAEKMGKGISAEIERSFKNDKGAVFFKLGFNKWDISNDANVKAKVSAVPVTVGMKYYLMGNFYGSLEGGFHNMKTKIKGSDIENIKTDKVSYFNVAPGIGYEFDMGKAKLDLAARYQYVSNEYNYIGMSVGINIPSIRSRFKNILKK